MNGEPSKESYAPFIAELIGTEMLKRIRRAWGKVIYKHIESGLKSCSPYELYKEWVKNRVAEIKLPFSIARTKRRKSNIQEESYEDKELMMKLANLKPKNSALEEKLIKLKTSFKDLQYETGVKTRSLENANKRARIDKECMDINQGRFGCRKQEFCFRPLNLL
ncbi:hypothetical protein P8452_44198 [Trifolium repens]|nr:hypothetical protein P8452_44198 [Trifolium repens]